MHVLATVTPIFAVVVLGFLARKYGFIPKEFLGTANQLVFHLALPALVFRSVSKASFTTDFNAEVLVLTIVSVLLIYFGSWFLVSKNRWKWGQAGSFIQCAGHGNQGFVGLPIALYYIGDSGLVKAAILAGFLFILQNTLSALALQICAISRGSYRDTVTKIGRSLLSNPIIVSAFGGMVISFLDINLPAPASRFLDIMAGMAAPLSLLLIGASLSFTLMQKNFFSVIGAVAVKLVVLPLTGLILFMAIGLSVDDYLPALILLGTPTATVAYVMAGAMGGDSTFAGAAISLSTILSSVTYVLWLSLVSYL